MRRPRFASRPGPRRSRRAAGRCGPTSSAPARSRERRGRARSRRGSSASSETIASARARRLAGRHEQAGLGLHDAAVARDVGGDDRSRAGERAREHHAEALAAERRRDERLRRQQLLGQLGLREEAEHVDSLAGHAQAREEEPHRKRIGADQRAAARRSARRTSGQARRSTWRPLRGSCRPTKTIRSSRPAGSASSGTRTPFGISS